MCARYELTTPPERMIERFGLRVPPMSDGGWGPRPFERGEVRPTNIAPVILPGGTVVALPWGLVVTWQDQPLINARAETLDTKPTFRPLLESRCLVPATAYFEWRRDGKNKIKTRISTADGLFAMAGLIDARGDTQRFTIVTCAPAPEIAHIHDRMPAVLDPAGQSAWLSAAPFADVKGVLMTYRGAMAFTEPAAIPPRQGALLL
ncbi:MAG: SOS response-associated peptidase [Rhodospirillaceae bacterium]|nr:SOS response-associated peptidase [Rhodospirillaceae bacterium]